MKASIFKVKYFSNTNSSITIEHVRFANYYTQFPTITASYKILYLLLPPALLVTNYRISIHARRISIFFTPRRSLDDWRTTIKAAPSIQQDLEVSRNDRRARLVSAIHDTQATLFAGYIAGRYCVVKSSTTKLIVGFRMYSYNYSADPYFNTFRRRSSPVDATLWNFRHPVRSAIRKFRGWKFEHRFRACRRCAGHTFQTMRFAIFQPTTLYFRFYDAPSSDPACSRFSQNPFASSFHGAL